MDPRFELEAGEYIVKRERYNIDDIIGDCGKVIERGCYGWANIKWNYQLPGPSTSPATISRCLIEGIWEKISWEEYQLYTNFK
jgi:hypothetical protein